MYSIKMITSNVMIPSDNIGKALSELKSKSEFKGWEDGNLHGILTSYGFFLQYDDDHNMMIEGHYSRDRQGLLVLSFICDYIVSTDSSEPMCEWIDDDGWIWYVGIKNGAKHLDYHDSRTDKNASKS